MKFLFRLFGLVAAACFIIVSISFTFAVVKKVWGGSKESKVGHVSVIDISGIILSASSFLRELQELTESPNTKAIVVRVNSPGGLVAPSQEMFEALLKADKKIPVFISMGSLAASGGYYAALGGRKVFASPGTLTASIGVIMEFANTQKLYQWAKVERFTIKAGKFKDVGSPLREMTPVERELLTAMAKDIHEQFRAAVKERRKLSSEELDSVADGRVMTGNQAKQAKLVDALGGFEDVVVEAKQVAGLPSTAPVVYPESKKGVLHKLFLGDDSEHSESRAGEWLGLVSTLFAGSDSLSSGWRLLLLSPMR